MNFIFVELIEAIKKTDVINEHALSEETENKRWFNPSLTENETISLEVPVINFSSKVNERILKEISRRKKRILIYLRVQFVFLYYSAR